MGDSVVSSTDFEEAWKLEARGKVNILIWLDTGKSIRICVELHSCIAIVVLVDPAMRKTLRNGI